MPVNRVAPAVVPPPVPPSAPQVTGGTGFHQGTALLHGWLPATVEAVAAGLLVVAVTRRSRGWWRWRLPVCGWLGALVAGGSWWYTVDEGLASDPAPVTLWLAIGGFAAAVAVAVLGWAGARWWRRGVALLAVLATLLAAGVVLDEWVGYYPTVESAWGALTAEPLPHQVDPGDLAALRGTRPTEGRIVPVTIPDAAQGFPHRTEYVYLPPAWFAGPTPPALPVLMMIGGEFNTPADWIRSGRIMPAVDAFAAAHGGQAPILVFVDSSGSFNTDTECVDGPRGAAATHLVRSVPQYVTSTFGASADPGRWAVAGWSMGGTCAVDLAAMHPELLRTFLDIAGDLGPASGTKEQTVARLYGGDAAAWDRYDPATVLTAHGPYTGVAGLFDDLAPPTHSGPPRDDHQVRPRPRPDEGSIGFGGRDGAGGQVRPGAATTLCERARAVGVDCTVYTTPGGHTWQFASAAFTSALPWLAARVGIA
ncbi:alpha/beta hydrolase [Nocardia thailandica]